MALCVYQIGSIFNGEFAHNVAGHVVGLVVALAVIALAVYMVGFKKYKEADKLTTEVRVK